MRFGSTVALKQMTGEGEPLRLNGFARAIRERCRVAQVDRSDLTHTRLMAAARAELGEQEADRALAEGAASSMDEVRRVVSGLSA